MPFANLLSTVYPASYAKGPRETLGLYPGESAFTRFTAWMGNNSSQSKQKRLTQVGVGWDVIIHAVARIAEMAYMYPFFVVSSSCLILPPLMYMATHFVQGST